MTPAQLGEMWGTPEVVRLEAAPIRIGVADELTSWTAEIPGPKSMRPPGSA
jgi:hypothetical protein